MVLTKPLSSSPPASQGFMLGAVASAEIMTPSPEAPAVEQQQLGSPALGLPPLFIPSKAQTAFDELTLGFPMWSREALSPSGSHLDSFLSQDAGLFVSPFDDPESTLSMVSSASDGPAAIDFDDGVSLFA